MLVSVAVSCLALKRALQLRGSQRLGDLANSAVCRSYSSRMNRIVDFDSSKFEILMAGLACMHCLTVLA